MSASPAEATTSSAVGHPCPPGDRQLSRPRRPAASKPNSRFKCSQLHAACWAAAPMTSQLTMSASSLAPSKPHHPTRIGKTIRRAITVTAARNTLAMRRRLGRRVAGPTQRCPDPLSSEDNHSPRDSCAVSNTNLQAQAKVPSAVATIENGSNGLPSRMLATSRYWPRIGTSSVQAANSTLAVFSAQKPPIGTIIEYPALAWAAS